MFRELKKISGILSDVGVMSRSEDPEEQEQAMFGAARELWEIVKPKIPSTLRDYAAQFWEQLGRLDVCDYFSLVRISVVLTSLIESSHKYIPKEFQDSVVPHLGAIMQLADRAKTLSRANALFEVPLNTDDAWDCRKCSAKNNWNTCECLNCGELSAPDKVVVYHAKLLRAVKHEIQGGSL